MNKEWYILDREGVAMLSDVLPERPDDARPSLGDEFRPWFKEDEHIHVEEGAITGIHGQGTLASLQARLVGYLEKESELLEHFGGKEDILISRADDLLNSS